MASATLRPGIAQGFYPERNERSEGWLDRGVNRLRGALARHWQRLPNRQRDFVDAVHKYGGALEGRHIVTKAGGFGTTSVITEIFGQVEGSVTPKP